MQQSNFTFHYAKDYTPSDFLIPKCELHFSLDENRTEVTSRLTIQRNPKAQNSSNTLHLDGKQLTLQNIQLNNQELTTKDYCLTPDELIIANVPDEFVLTTTVTISPQNNQSLSGLYLSNGNFCTQCEPDGFRRITYFIDRPDILSKFTITIVADKTKYPILLANGNIIDQGELEMNKHWVTWQDPTEKSAYLCALVAGTFAELADQYITKSGKQITLKIYADKKELSQCHYALASLKNAMHWEEENFGREYDLDSYMLVAIEDFNAAAMENKGLNIFNSYYILASTATSTDADFIKIAAVIAHEYFHNWTGNRITCRDWFQLGLKEGLTTFREQLFTQHHFSSTVERINTIRFVQTKQFAEDAGPLSHPVRLESYLAINNFYTVTVYYKSAEIARMLQTLVGTATFRKIMDKFFHDFDACAVTIEDFLNTAAKVTKIDLEQFKLWYDKAGTPTLKITTKYSKQKQTFELQLEQTSETSWHIPFAFGLIAPNGTEILNPSTEVLQLKNQNSKFSFTNVKEKPIPSLLRNFSAPIKIEYAYTDAELIFLIEHDQDFFSRWNAMQELMTRVILKLCHAWQKHQPMHLSSAIIHAIQKIINDQTIDAAFKAQLIALPSVAYCIEKMQEVDIDALYETFEFIKKTIATNLREDFLTCYQQNHEIEKPYSLDSVALGKRALKNQCLLYLVANYDAQIDQLLQKQYFSANNMTDAFGSLTALINTVPFQNPELLEDFYQKWQHDSKVVDKWLTLNANIRASGTLQRVSNLTKHQAFKITNPNKVLSLIRTFCENNLINFHQIDGAGYEFLANQVCIIDGFNQQLSTMILLPLTKWQHLQKPRSILMRGQLERILKQPNLSANVFELVTKALKF